jgi:ferric iron reductase protein FhuF
LVKELLDIEAKELQQFRLGAIKVDSELSIEVIDLLNEASLETYLNKVKTHLGAPDLKVAGSLFIKRYAFLPVLYLYALTVWDKKLDISFANLSIESAERDGLWLPEFRFEKLQGGNAGADRNQWRKDCVESLFKDHIFPVLDVTSQVSKASKLILWENIAIYIFWLYETVLPKEPSLVKKAEEDFEYIVYGAEGALFGNYHENPLKRYHNNKILNKDSGKEVRPRKTCCFSYMTAAGKQCGTCPIVCGKA